MIINKYTVDWALLRKWANENRFAGKFIIVFIMQLAVGVIGTISGVYFLCFSFYHGKDAMLHLGVYPYVLLLVGLISIYRALIERTLTAYIRYRSVSTAKKQKHWNISIQFTTEKIVIKDSSEYVSFSYDDITSIDMRKDVIIFNMNKNSNIHVYRNKFSSGCWTDCKLIINEKRPDLTL